MADLIRLGAQIDVRGGAAANAEIERFRKTTIGAAKASDQLAVQHNKMGNVFSRNRFALQNTAFQLQDVMVQLEMGVPITRTLGQQLPQLLGGFGALGAVAGLAAGALFSFAPLLFDIGKEVEDAAGAMDDFEDALSAVDSAIDLQAASVDDLRERYGELSAEVFAAIDGMVRAESRLARSRASAAVSSAFESGTSFFGFGNDDLTTAIETLERMETAAGRTARNAELAFAGMSAEVKEAAQAIVDFQQSSEEPLETQRDAALAAARALESLNDPDYDEATRNLFALADNLSHAMSLIQNDVADTVDSLEALGKTDLRGGRSAGRGGPTTAELERNSPAVQLAQQRLRQQEEEFKASQRSTRSGGRSANSELQRQQREAERIFQSTRTDIELLAAGVEELDEFLARGQISQDTYNRALEDLNERYDASTRSAKSLAFELESNLGTAFFSVVDGVRSAGDALMDFVNNVLLRIAEEQFSQRVAEPLGASLSGIIGGLFGSANGNVFGPSGVQPFAMGGVVNGPTVFPFANGIGLMGEAGPEAIMPLSRGSDGKLGVSGGGTKVIINNYSSERAETQTNGAGDLVVTIGRAIAADITSGGPSYRAIKSTFGLNQPMQRRG